MALNNPAPDETIALLFLSGFLFYKATNAEFIISYTKIKKGIKMTPFKLGMQEI